MYMQTCHPRMGEITFSTVLFLRFKHILVFLAKRKRYTQEWGGGTAPGITQAGKFRRL